MVSANKNISRQSIREHIYTSACWLGRASPQVTCCGNRKHSVSQALSIELPAQVIPDINSKSHYRSNRSGPQDFNQASLSDLFYISWSQTSLTGDGPPLPLPIFPKLYSFYPEGTAISTTPTHPSSRKGSERARVGYMTNMLLTVQI